MEYRKLGKTGWNVSIIGYGAAPLGGVYGKLDEKKGIRSVHTAVDLGINFIDTADMYSGGLAEQLTGQALKNLKVTRESVVVATKVFGEMGPGPNMRGASRGHVLDAVKASLKRLQLDHIDLYQIHAFDAATPIEETMRALDRLVRDGILVASPKQERGAVSYEPGPEFGPLEPRLARLAAATSLR